jgi:hypothetical protein
MADSYEHGSEPSGFIKDGEFFDYISVPLTFEGGLYSMELVYTFGLIPRTRCPPPPRKFIPTEGSALQKNADKHPCLE